MLSKAQESLSGVRSLIIGPYSPDFKLSDHFKHYNRDPVNHVIEWPELRRPWPDESGIVLASGSTTKFKDDRRPLAWFDFGFVSAQRFLDDTLPDSEETETNSVLIAANKITVTVINEWARLNPTYRSEALKTARVSSPELVGVLSEDREVMMDPRIRRHKIFDGLRNHPSPLVRACFAEDHDFFGERTKEVMMAAGGPARLLEMIETASVDLRARGVDICEDVTLGVAMCLRPLVPGVLPLPEQGIYIYAREYGCRLKPITKEDLERSEKGYDADFDYYEIPSKRVRMNAAQPDEKGKYPTIQNLRIISDPYHDEESPVAVGLTRLFNLLDAPQRKEPKIFALTDKPGATLLYSGQISQFKTENPHEPDVPGYERSTYSTEIDNLADLEKAVYHADGIVMGADPRDWNDPLERAMRKFEQRLLFSYIAALKPHGGFIGTGRPLMIEKKLYSEQFKYFSDFHDQGSVAGLTSDVVSWYEDFTHLQDKFNRGRWDMDSYKPNPEIIPEMKLVDEAELLKLMGLKHRDELGFCWAGLASASTHIESGLRDPYDFSRMAARVGMTCFSGGGARSGMGEIIRAHIDSYNAGDTDFRKIGIRVPVVSRHEGDIHDFLSSQNLSPVEGTMNDPYFSTLNRRMDFIETQHMAQRQHLIYMMAHAGVYFIHGIGGDYEANSNAYHNLKIRHGGKGIFPGTDLNTKIKPMFVVNSQVVNGRTYDYFDKYLKFITPQVQEMIGMQVLSTPQDAFRAMAAYARKLGYDVPDSEKTQVFMPGNSL